MKLPPRLVELESLLPSSLKMPRRVLQVGSPPSPQDDSKSKTSRNAALFFFLGGVVLLTIILIILFLYRTRNKSATLKGKKASSNQQQEVIMVAPSKQQQASMEIISGSFRTISYFDFQTLRRATGNFDPANLLGSGGFGPVYRGKLPDGRSLNLILHGNSDQFLNWNTRFFPEDQAYLSTTFAGTLGYTAPEYAIRGELSEKADIYSFGVLVLEIISCRKNTDLTLPSEKQYLPEYAWRLYERSTLMDLVDPKLKEDGFVEKDIMQAIHVALLCLNSHAHLRPPMSEIVALLTFKIEMVTTPMRPAFLERRPRNRRYDDNHSWEAITDAFPSPLVSDSTVTTPKLRG
ncbi:hypothetical protein L6164_013975 [Bauhinia variegata]|uniref:Uncharacterized protein n=1 Tax=Bauhinia variegata TaxID=167791 RepID=A0ACB9NGL9_BAUVA|nr:hypothetical protein L6164_013975 [Bauhinia variegata]